MHTSSPFLEQNIFDFAPFLEQNFVGFAPFLKQKYAYVSNNQLFCIMTTLCEDYS